MIEFAEEGEPLLLSLFENSEKYNYYRPNYERPNYNRPDLNKKDYYHAMMIKVPEPFYITPSASSRIYLTYHKKIGLLFTSFTFKDKEEPKVDIFYKLNEIDGIFQAEQYSKSYPISPDFTFIAEIDDILKP